MDNVIHKILDDISKPKIDIINQNEYQSKNTIIIASFNGFTNPDEYNTFLNQLFNELKNTYIKLKKNNINELLFELNEILLQFELKQMIFKNSIILENGEIIKIVYRKDLLFPTNYKYAINNYKTSAIQGFYFLNHFIDPKH